MLTNRIRFLWVKVHLSGGRNIHFHIPISLYILTELLDCFMDLVDIAYILSPKQPSLSSSAVSLHTVKSLMEALIKLIDSLDGKYELVSVEVDNVLVSVKIG